MLHDSQGSQKTWSDEDEGSYIFCFNSFSVHFSGKREIFSILQQNDLKS